VTPYLPLREKTARCQGDSDEYGDRYTIDFEMEHGGRHAMIRSG
jgi:hypothetical protein